MIDLVNCRIVIGDVDSPIKSFEVWFRSPFGLCKDLATAIRICKENDIDPRTCIISVSVAIGEQSFYEVM